MIKWEFAKITNTTTAPMQFTTLRDNLKALFNREHLLDLARKMKFVVRLRTLHPALMICALIQTLSTQRSPNLTDILRTLASQFQPMDNYKPFHNQLKKAELTHMMQHLTEEATRQWLLKPFQNTLPEKYPFRHIYLHDGSSLTLHRDLRDIFPGRFSKTAPAAIELHLTLDLVSGCANYLGIDADKESERLYQPYSHELKDTLVMMDAGYFDKSYCDDINKNGGFYIIRAKNNIAPQLHEIHDETGKQVSHDGNISLKDIKVNPGELRELAISWKDRQPCRLIAFWDRRHQRKSYVITNLSRDDFSAQDICRLYAMRWQVELFFKELKSFCGLTTFNTRNKNIVLTLVWSSMLTLLLKRYVAFSTALMQGILISTQKIARCSQSWLSNLLTALLTSEGLDDILREIQAFFTIHGKRAHPERDQKTMLLSLGLSIYPVVD